jgi:hypothetical protein
MHTTQGRWTRIGMRFAVGVALVPLLLFGAGVAAGDNPNAKVTRKGDGTFAVDVTQVPTPPPPPAPALASLYGTYNVTGGREHATWGISPCGHMKQDQEALGDPGCITVASSDLWVEDFHLAADGTWTYHLYFSGTCPDGSPSPGETDTLYSINAQLTSGTATYPWDCRQPPPPSQITLTKTG